MVERIKELRNEAVYSAMIARAQADDPLCDGSSPASLCFARKSVFDGIDEAISVPVTTADGKVHHVHVLTDWYTRRQLSIEATTENFELLLSKPWEPADMLESDLPEPPHEKVRYNGKKRIVYMRYTDGQRKRRHISHKVDHTSTRERLQEKVNAATDKLLAKVAACEHDSQDEQEP